MSEELQTQALVSVKPKPKLSLEYRTKQALEKAPFFVPTHNVDRTRFPLLAANIDQALKGRHEIQPAGTLSEAERLSLVKGTICPTNQEIGLKQPNILDECDPKPTERILASFSKEPDGLVYVGSVDEPMPKTIPVGWRHVDLEQLAKTGEEVRYKQRLTGPGKYAVITHREWSDEFRIRVQVEQPNGRPPENTGERVTNMLSLRGARAIAESCHYMAQKKGGYSTFLTLTFYNDARARIASGESTVQKESSRFFDGCQKTYQRGWTNKITGKRMKGHSEPLHYCWVVECPKNADGEDNPHVHILMKWKVPYSEFQGWAERIESLWGQGFAHLEKIREPENAGAYMAKAAGYLTKAKGDSDQGIVKGNRYGISQESRAPAWELIGRFEAGIMGSLIKDIYDYFTHLYGHVFQERRQLNQKLSQYPKGSKIRISIGKRLAKVRAKLNSLPAIASEYQITLKGWGSFSDFCEWARCPNQLPDGEWLPGKDAGDVWDAEQRPNSVWIHGLKNSINDYFSRLKRRKWERITYGEGWWDSLVNEYSELEALPYNDGREEYQNWGFLLL